MATCDSTIAVETTGDVIVLAPISMDLRLRIVGAVEHGSSIREEKLPLWRWWADLAARAR
jgi:hypothetical protein